MKRRILIVFIALGILLAIGLPLSNILNAASLINVTTQRYNLARNAVNTQETILKTSNVNVNNFGKLFSMPVVGDVYTQPLLVTGVTIPGNGVHNVVYVAIMHNLVYAYDADTAGPALWTGDVHSVNNIDQGAPFDAKLEANDIAGGEDGVLGTPVIDTTTRTMYLVSHHNGVNGGPPTHKIHALDITTGAEKFNGPQTISASIPGTGADADQFGNINYDANLQLQRPGLALDNGRVYVTMGSTGDRPVFHGWLFAYSASNLAAAPIVWLASPDGYGGGILTAGNAAPIDSNHFNDIIARNR